MPGSADPGDGTTLSRRRFLRSVAGCTGLLLAPLGALGAEPSPGRTVSLVNTHTGETLSARYCSGDAYDAGCLVRVNHFLRDFRSGEVHPIDPRLLDILYRLQVLADREATYEVISGYRSPQTNAALHRSSSGVSVHSLHMYGRAIDVRMQGLPTCKLHELALSLWSGGVGYYPHSDFVHLDTGRVRRWEG